MTDALGYRLKIAVIAPSTNTIVQPEMDAMRPRGVTNHMGRIVIPNAKLGSDADFSAHIERMRSGIDAAIDSVMSAEPGYIANGLSLEAFWEGLKGSLQMVENLEKKYKLGVSMGNNGILAALKKYSGIRKVALITPHRPMGDARVKVFFEEAGYTVTDLHSFNVMVPAQICHVPAADLRAAVKKVNESKPDAIIQVGTGLCMAEIAGEAEFLLDKPVIAINTAIYWHALRQNKITDKIRGFGSLLETY